jgi:hypothetical protein
MDLDDAKAYDIRVTVDLPSGQVTMKVGPTTVTAALKHCPARVAQVGYAVHDAATNFGPVEIVRQ